MLVNGKLIGCTNHLFPTEEIVFFSVSRSNGFEFLAPDIQDKDV